jgi:hypothetical protein
MYSKLADTLTDRPNSAGIAKCHAINPSGNFGCGTAVPKPREPVRGSWCSANFH